MHGKTFILMTVCEVILNFLLQATKGKKFCTVLYAKHIDLCVQVVILDDLREVADKQHK